MAIASTSLVFDSGTDANFRAWGSGIAGLLTTGGFWTKAGDSGQVNWTTVTSPAANGLGGWEMYVSNDALSTSFPVYMKVMYYNNGSSTKAPRLDIQFGTGTNGAGTLTGNVSGVISDTTGTLAGTGATTYPWYASGGPGYFAILGWLSGSTSMSFCLVIERSLDATGTYTNQYVTWLIAGYSTYAQQSMFRAALGGFGPGTTTAGGSYTIVLPGTTAALGSYAGVFPVFPFVGYFDNCMTAILGMKTGDQSEQAQFSATLYGVSHNYMYTKNGQLLLATSVGIAIRYD